MNFLMEFGNNHPILLMAAVMGIDPGLLQGCRDRRLHARPDVPAHHTAALSGPSFVYGHHLDDRRAADVR